MNIKFFTGQRSSFTYLNATQFLGALNDNIFRWLLAFFLIDIVGEHKRDMILAIAGAVFVLPFLLFSSGSGTLADRFSKRNIIVLMKLMEVAVMLLGLLAFWQHFVVGAYLVLFLMATQSAIFSPSKYGIVPELVKEERLSQANGLLSVCTYGAIILGSFLGGLITQVSDHNYVFGASICVFIALVGFLVSRRIEHTPPAGSKKSVSARIFTDTWKTLRRAKREPTLLIAMLGSAYFLFVGAYIQLNCVPFAQETLGLNQEAGSYLFFLTSIGIGLGSLIVGKISGKWVELGVVPIGGILMSIGCIMLDQAASNLTVTICTIVLTGMVGGMYLIPLDTFIQVASPQQIRGQAIAATNFMAYIGVLAASGVFMIIGPGGLGYDPGAGFALVGSFTLIVAIGMMLYLRDYLIRFLGMVWSRVCFEMSIEGYESLSKAKPAVFVTPYEGWADSLLLMGSQRRRLHFFVESRSGSSTLMQLLGWFLKVKIVNSLEPEEISKRTLQRMRKAVRRGLSVCLFLDPKRHSERTVDELITFYTELLNRPETPIIPVNIRRQMRYPSPQPAALKVVRFVRMPASVTFEVDAHA